MIKIRNILLLFLFMIAAFPVLAQTSQNDEPEHYVSVRALSDQSTVQGGDTIRIAIEQKIYPHWHTYWQNPGDSGLATSVEWDLPSGFIMSELEWPTPKKIAYGPLTNYGYEGQTTLLQNLTLPDTISDTPFELSGTVNLLVCHDICIPESHDITISFNNGSAAETRALEKAEEKLPAVKKWAATHSEKDGNLIVAVTTNDTSILNSNNIALTPKEWGIIDNTTNTTITKTETGFELRQKRGERDLSELKALSLVIGYDGKGIELNSKLNTETSATVLSTNEQSNAAIQNENNGSSIILIQALIFAFFGGIILNLMPCVFPVLSIKALSLINLNEKEEKKARQYGLSYTAGILISFGLIAAILLILKASGEQIGWGFQLQNSIVITVLVYLVFLIGLNLSGFFEFTSKLSNIGQGLTQKSGHSGAFFTGVLATLVATPCTAPFMGTAMGFALTQPAAISMLVFLTLGFGLAFPYLILCYVPALRAKLPKPGAWMETFRQFLAFPMFITAAWLIWVLSQQVSSLSILCVLLGLIAIALIIWLRKNWPQNKIGKIFAILLFIGSVIFTIMPLINSNKTQNQTQIEQSAFWDTFSLEALDTALAGDQPIFVEMTAAWCITCKVNEKVALNTNATKKLFSEQNVKYLKGDWTNKDATITQYLDSFDRSGVPIYVYYGAPDEQTGKRPDAILLPQILTPGIVKAAIQ